jgi:hypothetical protein
MTAPLEDRTEAGGMPGETIRAGAVMTLTMSVFTTLVLVLAAGEQPAPRAEHARPAQHALSR